MYIPSLEHYTFVNSIKDFLMRESKELSDTYQDKLSTIDEYYSNTVALPTKCPVIMKIYIDNKDNALSINISTQFIAILKDNKNNDIKCILGDCAVYPFTHEWVADLCNHIWPKNVQFEEKYIQALNDAFDDICNSIHKCCLEFVENKKLLNKDVSDSEFEEEVVKFLHSHKPYRIINGSLNKGLYCKIGEDDKGNESILMSYITDRDIMVDYIKSILHEEEFDAHIISLLGLKEEFPDELVEDTLIKYFFPSTYDSNYSNLDYILKYPTYYYKLESES